MKALNETLGVKVSVSPEFDDEDQSLISGRINSSGVNNSAKIRSATKIRLTKRISNSVNMSFSSTLGGSLDQRQEMNLNYRINSIFCYKEFTKHKQMIPRHRLIRRTLWALI